MRIIYIGCVVFSKELFELLLKNSNIKIVGLVTKKNSTFNSDHYDLSKSIINTNIPFKYVKDINELKIKNWIKNLKPDLIFCFGWPTLLKKDILNLPKIGVVGYHPTILPKNRGRHPIIWALILGLKETGSTFFFMDEEADTGKIINQSRVKIDIKDDANSLYLKLIEASKIQLTEIIENFISNKLIVFKKQSKGNFWRKRSKKDGLIDWRMSELSIYNLIRGLTRPYSGAHFEYQGKEIKVWKCEIIRNNSTNIEPGKIISLTSKGIIVKTGDHSIHLTEFEDFEIKSSYL